MFCVKLSTSAKTGIFPVLTIHEAEEKKLRFVTIISDLAYLIFYCNFKSSCSIAYCNRILITNKI